MYSLTTVDLAEVSPGLPLEYASRIDGTDFLFINDAGGAYNCPYCTAAGFRAITVSRLFREVGLPADTEVPPLSLGEVVHLLRIAGMINAQVSFAGTPADFKSWLDRNLPADGTVVLLALAYTRRRGKCGHVVNARVWRRDNRVHLLITDFQMNQLRHRFSSDLPTNAETVFAIYVGR